MRVRLIQLTILMLMVLSVGCSAPYTLRGKVIPGNISYSLVVGNADERLDDPGIGGVKIRLVSDPDKLKREIMGETITKSDGTFEIPFETVGAGLMLYNVGITARLDGYAPTVSSGFNLPPSARRVLVLMVPGKNNYKDPIENSPGAMADQLNR